MTTNFSIMLRKLREERSLTQKQLSNAIGINQANISRWESGTQNPSTSGLAALAKFFGVTTDFLLGLDK